MAIYAKTTLAQSPKSHTQYLTIPASVVTDSQYPFEEEDQEVEMFVDGSKKILIVSKIKEEEKEEGGESG